ncbi:AI-2E family transporter [Pedobacter psychrophilus]|uniref:AI-2E family transporter n=1 Tax=Pedobacter psychrophilus TaxID=1826909 RepID=A0A179DLQ8_9SPHI|nr:AI-2E family transporter [Pedobacter psychrophilus]OAQ41650.1 AI-2E family transporter [Pedobacter psychrophilus]
MQVVNKEYPFYLKLACILLSIIALCYIAIYTKELLSPLIFSCLFSMVLMPLTNFFEKKWKFHRGLAAMVSVLLLLSLIILVLYFIGSQVSNLADDWPRFQSQLNSTVQKAQIYIESTLHIKASKQLDYIHQATTKLLSSSTVFAAATLLSLSSIFLFLIFTFIYTFFFLLYRRLIKKFLMAVFKDENSLVVIDVIENVQSIIRKYILGLLLEMAIVAAIACLAFWALGIKYAILLGLITGIFNIIPYIGIFVALVISVLITFATATILSKTLLVLITIIIIHLIDSNILLPIIVGSKVRINALITILGVVIGEMLWGISGMFLSIPVMAVLKIIFDRIESFKPWGMIMGEDEKVFEPLEEILS